MHILTVDVGTYSVKFLETKLERKNLVYLASKEVLLSDARSQYDTELSTTELQQEIIRTYLDYEEQEGKKIISQLPPQMVTSRYLLLPVNSYKKADQLIPFQLEENLPYAISGAHYTSELHRQNGKIMAIVNITKRNSFEQYYNALGKKNILPAVLSSELSIVQHFVYHAQIIGPAFILDLGHTSSKAYFIYNGNVVANHISYIGGKTLTDVIAKTYNLNDDEAEIYKHNNCFVLTSSQYAEVDQAQQEFARLIKQALWPLLLDIKRWEVGFRVKHIHPMQKIYLTGGCSNITNIERFLAEELACEVERLDVFRDYKKISFPFDKKQQHNFGLSQLMSYSQLTKRPLLNFLKGNYSSSFDNTIPLHSTVFIATRVFIVAFILLLSLVAERFFLQKELASQNTRITKLLKTPGLELTAKEQQQFKKRPQTVYKNIKKKKDQIERDIKLIKQVENINEVDNLVTLSKILSNNKEISLLSFQSDAGQVQAIFEGTKIEEINALETVLKNSKLNQATVLIDANALNLTLEYKGK